MAYQAPQIDNIEDYLRQHENKELLRFITCGSVDDGKSTLIGRLLHDSKVVFEDQLAAITRDSQRHGTTGEEVDLALLVDGLQSEREQGITIDVAYRFFATDQRKYIIADTPGHEQYTRNMATGASTADAAILLIDARHGMQVQTRRHSFICALLGIRHFIIAINKMDLVDYDQARFDAIRAEYAAFVAPLGVANIHYVPLSALAGENVVQRSTRMPWHTGPALLEILDHLPLSDTDALEELRFPVQYVNRPHLDFRGYCGTVAAGTVAPGDEIKVLPSGQRSRVRSIVTWDGEQPQARAGQAVTLTLQDEIDISRGDMIISAQSAASTGHNFMVNLVWMHEAPLKLGKVYDFKLGATSGSALVSEVLYQVDVNTLAHQPADSLPLNGIGLVRLQLTSPVVCDRYRDCRATGSLILIDRLSNATVAAGMIDGPDDEAAASSSAEPVTAQERSRRLGQQPASVHVQGVQASALAQQLERALFDAGAYPYFADAETAAERSALSRAGVLVVHATTTSAPAILEICLHGDTVVTAALDSPDNAISQILQQLHQHQLLG
ncbi:sulfate adenylyltransferase subunit CysN [Isoalcanivorax beigongshangi]|uniref:Sulfate adenylyltransferase subunit 1 n=1 Tax=Isoalcanivorax beigongshangi TaxID=3238810 RepID=A0ABV4AG63_9GAMM